MNRTTPLALLAFALALAACDDGGRQRADIGGETPADAGPMADMADLDAAPTDGAPPDAGPDAAPDAADRGPTDDFALPDFGPPMDEECNGEDDDLDGVIDEEVANICGGCGGLPPQGCQAWRINLVQDPAGTLLPFRTVGLQAQVQSRSRRVIPGADCDVLRLAEAPSPDAHLGVVAVDGSQADLNLVPTFEPAIGGFRYDNSPELGRTALYDGGETVGLLAGGGLLVGPFDAMIDAPPVLDGIGEEALRPILDAARGDAPAAPPSLTWTPAPPDRYTATRLFVGGSVPVFGATRLYRGIEFYQVDARLRDDGALTLDPALFGAGVPNSSIWVYAIREAVRRLPIGAHAVEIVAGQRIELRETGAAEPMEGAEAPFAILAPDPNAPEYTAGEPLEVMWGPLPDGDGPLQLSLAYRDPLAAEQVQIDCVIDDPADGALTLPAEFTEGLPEDDFAQLTLRWGLDAVDLPAPDEGTWTRAVSMILRLDR